MYIPLVLEYIPLPDEKRSWVFNCGSMNWANRLRNVDFPIPVGPEAITTEIGMSSSHNFSIDLNVS